MLKPGPFSDKADTLRLPHPHSPLHFPGSAFTGWVHHTSIFDDRGKTQRKEDKKAICNFIWFRNTLCIFCIFVVAKILEFCLFSNRLAHQHDLDSEPSSLQWSGLSLLQSVCQSSWSESFSKVDGQFDCTLCNRPAHPNDLDYLPKEIYLASAFRLSESFVEINVIVNCPLCNRPILLAIGFSIQIIQIICQSCRTGLYQTAFFAGGRFVWMMWNICTKREQIGSLICVKILLLNDLTEAPQHISCLLVHWPEGEETVAKSWKRSWSSSAKQ